MLRPFLIAVCIATLSASVSLADWARFRGPNGTGVAESSAPTEFGEKKNLQWKLELPGRGVSSPIVVGDRALVTCYSGYGMGGDDVGDIEQLKRHLVCASRVTGEILWTKTVAAKQPEDPYRPPGVTSHGYASHTPASDGKSVFAFFGKSGVYAFDLDGNEQWNQSVGTESGPMRWGSAASPIVHGDFVIVNASDEGEALVWLDKRTGVEKHRAEAAGLSNSWTTPVLMKSGQGTELVISVPGEIWGLNAANGDFLWYSRGTSSNNSQISVLPGDDVVYITGGRGGEAVAVRVGGKGDVNESNIVWEGRSAGSYATPVLHDGHLFSVNGNVVSCIDAASGKRIFQKRLTTGESVAANETGGQLGGQQRGGQRRGGGPGGFGGRGGYGRTSDYASPVLADGNIYITAGAGTIYVVAAKPKYELVSANDMTFDTSGFSGTPAISDGQLFLRSNTHLYCIGEK